MSEYGGFRAEYGRLDEKILLRDGLNLIRLPSFLGKEKTRKGSNGWVEYQEIIKTPNKDELKAEVERFIDKLERLGGEIVTFVAAEAVENSEGEVDHGQVVIVKKTTQPNHSEVVLIPSSSGEVHLEDTVREKKTANGFISMFTRGLFGSDDSRVAGDTQDGWEERVKGVLSQLHGDPVGGFYHKVVDEPTGKLYQQQVLVVKRGI